MGKFEAIVEAAGSGVEEEKATAIATLVRLAQDRDRQDHMFAALVELCQQGRVKCEDLAPSLPAVLAIWRDLHNDIQPLQQDPGKIEWMLDADYRHMQQSAEWLLDLLGYAPGESVGAALREGLMLSDPTLKTFAAFSILRHGEAVDPVEIERIAASHVTRMTLWLELRKRGMEHFMPAKWAASELLAASDLARWMNFPTELGVPPEELELVKTYPVEIDGAELNAYLFRFREYPKPWEPGAGWMAGIAGPILDGVAQRSPWSAFDEWDSLPPDEHFAKLFGRGSQCDLDP